MVDEAAASIFPEELRGLIVARLRRDHPWMKIDAVNAAANAQAELFATQVEEQRENVEASKARCSFMSLPPELRTWIYELVLIPEEDEDGGVPDMRAIAIGTRAMGDWGGSTREWPPAHETTWAQQPALSRTSRAVRDESLPVYYGRNHFVACSRSVEFVNGAGFRVEVDISATEAWLARIGSANEALVNNLEICHNISVDGGCPDWSGFIEGWNELAGTLTPKLPASTKHLCLQKDYDTGEEWWQPTQFSPEQAFQSDRRLPGAGSLAYREAYLRW